MGGEDNFPQGRPPLEKIGAKFVADVGRHELMKLRILNGGHAAIAYPSTLLGHHLVHDAMADPQIATSLRALETREIISALADALRDDNAIEGLAQEVAFWSRCCKATDEAGNAIPPDDGNSDALRKCALAARRDPLAFLANDTVFGTLAAKPRFHEAFPAS